MRTGEAMSEGANAKRKDAGPGLGGPADVTPSQIKNLLAAAEGAFETGVSSGGTLEWEPPGVEMLRGLLPQYEISGFVARGGMGAVYRGIQKALNREVAIKVLPPEMHGDGPRGFEFATRFRMEAEALARLGHPNIVSVFDAGEVNPGEGGGSPALLYFVMEFVEGQDLAQLIRNEGPLAAERVVPILSAVCDALAFAHEEGILHRDIKPSNIIIDRKGRVKVADFGLAKAVHHESLMLTRTNQAMGTQDYVAPEATLPDMKLDARSDVYSVGVMLYQMLTGTIPRGRFESPSGVVPCLDRRFDAIVDKAMQADRDRRYSTAAEMKAALLGVATGNPRWPGGESGAGIPRHIRLWAAAVMIFLAISGGFMMLNQAGRDSQTPGQSVSGSPINGNPVPPVNGLTSPAAASLIDPKPMSAVRQWTEVTDFVRAEGLKNGGMKLNGEWLQPTRQGIWVSLAGSPLPANVAIRVRFACRVELNMRKTEGTGGGFYSLGVGGPFQYISRTIDSTRTDLVPAKVLDSGFIDGSEHELIAATHQGRLYLILDGKTHLAATDTTFPNGSTMLAMYDDGPGKMARVRKVEWMNLDGLDEKAARKLAGLNSW